MFSVLIILLCLATSMIELFMLDLVMFMIYLFWNLIMQLPNTSTSCRLGPQPPRDVAADGAAVAASVGGVLLG